MPTKSGIAAVRVLPEDVANKIAAGEVVERPASVVKELVENALDAGATRVLIRLVAAGRRTIEVVDNGHGMSEQDALLAIERYATSKIRKAADLDHITTLGFRGEALASIASVSRFELVTRTAGSETATRVRIEGGVLRDISQVSGPVGTRVTVNRLYFNTPVRAKFLKGITTELSQAIDIAQRHALAARGVAFQFVHNDKTLLDIPENADLRDRVALIWGLGFASEMIDLDGERTGLRLRGLVGTPGLTRAQRSHQFFFLNGRPVVNRPLQYGLEDGYRGLLTVGRHPVCILLLDMHPRFVDVNIHPTKREIRFRDERAARDAIRDIVRDRLAAIETPGLAPDAPVQTAGTSPPAVAGAETAAPDEPATEAPAQVQTEFVGRPTDDAPEAPLGPQAVFASFEGDADAPMQVFDTYLLVPDGDRLLIIDQHALHERLTYDGLRSDLEDNEYEAQELAVPLVIEVPPSHARLLESNTALFSKLGIQIEPFGSGAFQVTAICHAYDEGKVPDAVYRVLDEVAQGDLFDREDFVSDLLRLTVAACRASVMAGDRLAPEERRGLLEGFRRLRPPYTCPHGRPIITELTQSQVEKSFRRRT